MPNSPLQSFMQGLSSFFSAIRHPINSGRTFSTNITGFFQRRRAENTRKQNIAIKAQETDKLIEEVNNLSASNTHFRSEAIKNFPANFKAWVEIVNLLKLTDGPVINLIRKGLLADKRLDIVSTTSNSTWPTTNDYLNSEISKSLLSPISKMVPPLGAEEFSAMLVYLDQPASYLSEFAKVLPKLADANIDLNFLKKPSNLSSRDKLEIAQTMLRLHTEGLLTPATHAKLATGSPDGTLPYLFVEKVLSDRRKEIAQKLKIVEAQREQERVAATPAGQEKQERDKLIQDSSKLSEKIQKAPPPAITYSKELSAAAVHDQSKATAAKIPDLEEENPYTAPKKGLTS